MYVYIYIIIYIYKYIYIYIYIYKHTHIIWFKHFQSAQNTSSVIFDKNLIYLKYLMEVNTTIRDDLNLKSLK